MVMVNAKTAKEMRTGVKKAWDEANTIGIPQPRPWWRRLLHMKPKRVKRVTQFYNLFDLGDK